MKRTTIYIDEKDIEKLDKITKRWKLSNRSETIREMIKQNEKHNLIDIKKWLT